MPTAINTLEGVYDITVTLTDGGGLSIDCAFQVEYTYPLNITFENGVSSACMSNGSGSSCGAPYNVEATGSFTIDNADPFAGAPFKLQGSANGPENEDLEIGYICRIFNNAGTEVASLNAGTDRVYDVNESNTEYLFDGNYTYEIEINNISLNFPPLPPGGSVTQATATIINEP